MGFKVVQKLKENIAAVRVALSQQEGVPLTDEQLSVLRKFCGFGAFKAVIYGDGTREEWQDKGATALDLEHYDYFNELYTLLRTHLENWEYTRVVDSLKESSLTAFYTPEFVPQAIFNAMSEEGISPKMIYDPCAGAGVFTDSAITTFTGIEHVTAVEKDLLTGMILHCIMSSYPVSHQTRISGLEETPTQENGKFDLITGNIPFGNISVYDPAFPQKAYSSRIHNYFFVKSLDKLADGGILAFLTTDAFLNSSQNETARNYLFQRADLISLNVMPENLMTDTGNTRATSHLLIVQKNTTKLGLSEDENLLIKSKRTENEYGEYWTNVYVSEHPELILGNKITSGLNQYGESHLKILQEGELQDIAAPLQASIAQGLRSRFKPLSFSNKIERAEDTHKAELAFVEMPPKLSVAVNVQMGLFDTNSPEEINRAMDYLSDADLQVVKKESARLLGIIRVKERPEHEVVVLLTAKHRVRNYYVYALRANVRPLSNSVNWMNAENFSAELRGVANELNQYEYNFVFEGDRTIAEHLDFKTTGKQIYKDIKPYFREGTLIMNNGQLGLLKELNEGKTEGVFEPVVLKQYTNGFFAAYIALRDQYFQLASEQENDQIRDVLRSNYEAFVSEFGQLNRKDNQHLILQDSAHGLLMLSSLERRVEDKYEMSDILVHELHAQLERPETNDPAEALAYCLNAMGHVDLDYIGEIIGQDQKEVLQGLKRLIFLNPGSGLWETADQYTSGEVVEKLKIAEEAIAAEPENSYFKDSHEAIRKAQPEKIPFELLDFNFGERWIPTSLYSEYLTDLLETEVTVRYFEGTDDFKVKYQKENTKTNKEFCIQPRSGHKVYAHTLVEAALVNTSPHFTYEVNEVRKPDNDAIQLAHEKIERIRTGFSDWLSSRPDEVKRELENTYNSIYNSKQIRKYDGSHLQFPGLDFKGLGIEDLYSSQKDAVWRIIQDRGGLMDHEVGLGKTMIMVTAAHEMKRLGICRKPLMLTLNANISEIADTYRKGYPMDKVLIPDEKDFTPKNRQRLFHEMRNNDWDAIIITHDQFLKIAQSPAIQQQILDDELSNVRADLDAVKEAGGGFSKKMLRGLEVREKNLINALKLVHYKLDNKRDEDVDIESMGIDHLLVDEAHKFKNLMFSTRHGRVAGLGNVEGSQKALNLLEAVRLMQQKFDSDFCATFLTGTPISNSLTEMYLLFKYLRPRELKRQFISNFDSWAAVYAKKTTDFEFSVTGEITAKERFRHFIKVPELALAYNEMADFKTADLIKLKRPKVIQKLVNIKPSPAQEEFIQNLIKFAQTGDGALIHRGKLSDSEDKGRMLIATHAAKNMAVDMRLISPEYGDHPDNKINKCARNAFDIYRRSEGHSGVQLIFCDLGTPGTKGFCIYDALKEALVKQGVPAQEITYIHDWTRAQRPELFKLLNAGTIRFLIGSTEKAGTGLNVQKKVVAIHHMDIPYRPIDLQQRDGRGGRPGNEVIPEYYNNILHSYIYATEKSLDGYKFNLLKIKHLFATQFKNNQLAVRRIDEGGVDEQSGMNYSEYVAILSGDNSLLEKSRLEKKVAQLESLRTVHFRETTGYRRQGELNQLQLERKIAIHAQLKDDEVVYRSQLLLDKKGVKINAVELKETGKLGTIELAGYLLRMHRDFKGEKHENPKSIGTIYGFELYIENKKVIGRSGVESYNYFYAQRAGSDIKYTSMDGQPNKDNLPGTARIFLNGIDKVSGMLVKYQQEIKERTEELALLQKLSSKPYEREEELKRLKVELDTLTRKIQGELAEKNQQASVVGISPNVSVHISEVDVGDVKVVPLVPVEGQERRKRLGL